MKWNSEIQLYRLQRTSKAKSKLNAKIRDINYEEDADTSITYYENGVMKKVHGRSALVTASLGLLKAGTTNFIQPFLMINKKQSITLALGALNKCVMYWEDPNDDIVWPTDKLWFELVTPEDETSGKLTMDLKGVPMPIGWIGGDDASTKMEEQSDEEVLDDAVMKNLSAMFPSIRRPTMVLITMWWKDENVRGANSFQRVHGKFERDAAVLGERTKNFWFAGEAISANGWHGTTIGGWETGEEAARRMASALKNNFQYIINI